MQTLRPIGIKNKRENLNKKIREIITVSFVPMGYSKNGEEGLPVSLQSQVSTRSCNYAACDI